VLHSWRQYTARVISFSVDLISTILAVMRSLDPSLAGLWGTDFIEAAEMVSLAV
jgi:hypothetical protein